MNYSVYWIRNPNETDILTEGYVGVTNDFDRRMKEHGDKYGDVKTIINANLSYETACKVEKELRPSWYIGKNIAPGGQAGNRPFGIHTSGWTHSEESKKKRSEMFSGENNAMYGKKLSEEHKKALHTGASKALKGKKKWYKVTTPKLFGTDNPRAKGCIIDGVEYETLNDASEKTGINRTTIAHRCKSKNYPEYVRNK